MAKPTEFQHLEDIALGDLWPVFDISTGVTKYVTTQQAKEEFQNTPNIGMFPPVSDVVNLRNVNISNALFFVNQGAIVAGKRIFILDRTSLLPDDGLNVFKPNHLTSGQPGRWIADAYIQSPNELQYNSLKTYDNSGLASTSFTEYAFKFYKYVGEDPTTEDDREAVLGAGFGIPADNLYWEEVSKTEVDSLAGGWLRGTYPNPEIAMIDGGEI